MTNPAQRILIVDDDKEIARLLRAYLEEAGFQVLVAHDGESALHIMRRDNPTLVVLDLMLPQRDGLDVTRIARKDTMLRIIPLIMLTARIEDVDKIVGLELGADDYITKPFNPREVVARIRAVLRRTLLTPDAPLQTHFQSGDLILDTDRHEATLNGQPLELTPTEFKLLLLFMSHPGHAFTRAEIAESVVGYDNDFVERTVDTHIKNIRKKIEPDVGNPSYILTVYGYGYRLAGKDS